MLARYASRREGKPSVLCLISSKVRKRSSVFSKVVERGSACPQCRLNPLFECLMMSTVRWDAISSSIPRVAWIHPAAQTTVCLDLAAHNTMGTCAVLVLCVMTVFQHDFPFLPQWSYVYQDHRCCSFGRPWQNSRAPSFPPALAALLRRAPHRSVPATRASGASRAAGRTGCSSPDSRNSGRIMCVGL